MQMVTTHTTHPEEFVTSGKGSGHLYDLLRYVFDNSRTHTVKKYTGKLIRGDRI